MNEGREAPLNILCIDDEPSILTLMRINLTALGHHVETFDNGRDAIKVVRDRHFDVAFIDIIMPEMNGLEVLERVRALSPTTDCIIATSFGTVEYTIESLRRGAIDFIIKPIGQPELRPVLGRVAERRSSKNSPSFLHDDRIEKTELEDDVGLSPMMMELSDLINIVAPTDCTILITGETGTGKELVARQIWQCSTKSDDPFVVVDCANLSETTTDSELFGNGHNISSDEDGDRQRHVHNSLSGTLFFDEVGELPIAMQGRLLRFFENCEIRPTGATEPVIVDTRIICATRYDLRHLSQEGKFRKELYYRLQVIELTVPRLAERSTNEIRTLAEQFLVDNCKRYGKTLDQFSPDVMEQLLQHSWPGNVRELKNIIERTVLTSPKEWSRVESLTGLGSPLLGTNEFGSEDSPASIVKKDFNVADEFGRVESNKDIHQTKFQSDYRNDIFISYCHQDTKWISELRKHLSPYVRKGQVTIWDDSRISPGAEWRNEILTALDNTRVAVLLVSPSFLASDFINDEELPRLLKSAEQDGITIMWIPVSASSYHETSIARYQAVLDPATPLDGMSEPEQHHCFVTICKAINSALLK